MENRLYYKRKNAGLCVKCGKPVDEHRKGKVYCQSCTDAMVENAKEKKAYLRDKGLCICGNKLYGYEKVCYDCKTITALKYYRRKDAGECVKCGVKLDRKGIYCIRCNLKDKRRNK